MRAGGWKRGQKYSEFTKKKPHRGDLRDGTGEREKLMGWVQAATMER